MRGSPARAHDAGMAGSELTVAPAPASPLRDGIRRALRAALAVFFLDGLYVVAVFGFIVGRTTPERIFRGIAFALLGPPAMTGGWKATALGVLLHFCVALGWSTVWVLACEGSARLRRAVATAPRAAMIGCAYGLVIWLAMRFAVLPLTWAKPGPLNATALLVLLAHLSVVGPPIALLTRRPEPTRPGASYQR